MEGSGNGVRRKAGLASLSSLSTHERIRFLREASGLTRKELAKRAKVSERAVDAWERGERSPSDENLGFLADALEVPPALLKFGFDLGDMLLSAGGGAEASPVSASRPATAFELGRWLLFYVASRPEDPEQMLSTGLILANIAAQLGLVLPLDFVHSQLRDLERTDRVLRAIGMIIPGLKVPLQPREVALVRVGYCCALVAIMASSEAPEAVTALADVLEPMIAEAAISDPGRARLLAAIGATNPSFDMISDAIAAVLESLAQE